MNQEIKIGNPQEHLSATVNFKKEIVDLVAACNFTAQRIDHRLGLPVDLAIPWHHLVQPLQPGVVEICCMAHVATYSWPMQVAHVSAHQLSLGERWLNPIEIFSYIPQNREKLLKFSQFTVCGLEFAQSDDKISGPNYTLTFYSLGDELDVELGHESNTDAHHQGCGFLLTSMTREEIEAVRK